MADLSGLYRGALLGQALSKQIGSGLALGTSQEQQVRGALLQTGVATGRIKPQQLSPYDAGLLGKANQIAGIVPHPTTGGTGGILGVLETPFKVAANTAGDLASALEGIPAGLVTAGEATVNTLSPVIQKLTGAPTVSNQGPVFKGSPNLGGLASGVAKQTVQDFTKFDPMHPLFPLLDVAALASGGSSALVRSSEALSRLAAAGRAASEGRDVGLLGRTVGTSRAVQRASEATAPVRAYASTPRPIVNYRPQDLSTAREGTQLPFVTPTYSTSPFKRLFIEKPADRFFQSPVALSAISELPIVGKMLPEGRTLGDVRTNYLLRKEHNVLRGRASSGATQNLIQSTQGFNHAMSDLMKESSTEAVASEKFNALVLMRMLAAEGMNPEDRLATLDQYRERVLGNAGKGIEGAADTVEAGKIRKFYDQLTASPEYRNFFAHPTEGMMNVRDEWDKAILQGLKSMSIDPHEVLNRSLGPAAHVRNMTPEELLREQNPLVRNTTQFAVQAHDLEQAIRKAEPGEMVPERGLIPEVAALLPDSIPLPERQRLIEEASQNLGPRDTIAARIAEQLPHYGVPEFVAERYAVGGLTNYFPQASAADSLKVLKNRMRVKYVAANGKGEYLGQPVGLRQFQRERNARLLTSSSLGVGTFANFLKDADLSSFKAGIDRRDPVMFTNHVAQRERWLANRLLSDPMIQKMALKDEHGVPIDFTKDGLVGLQQRLGSMVAAQRYALIPAKALQLMTGLEDSTAAQVGELLKSQEFTPELSAHIDELIDQSSLGAVRELSNEAANGKTIAVPRTYMDNLIRHAQVLDSSNKAGHLWQAFIGKWRTAVLAYMPSWLLRTSMGHGILTFLGGVWNPKYYNAAVNYFGEGWKLPGTDLHLSKGLDREVPIGIQQGASAHDAGQAGMASSPALAWSQGITSGVHHIANFQRRAAFLHFLDKGAREKFASLDDTFLHPGGFRDVRNIDNVIQNHPDVVHHALNELDKVSYSFGQMSPWERRLAKNILPFWGWYKFVSRFVWTLPMNYPGRTLAIAHLGDIGKSETDQLGPMPDWLKNSIFFDTHNLNQVHYMSMMGLNPLGDVMNPAHGFQGLVRLGQMSPVIQAALQGMGYNTMTGGLESIDPARTGIIEINGKYVNLNTGQQYDSLDQASPGWSVARAIGGIMRSFPEARIGELLFTHGQPVYPESIPGVIEHPVPVAPGMAKSISPGGIAAQLGGVAPKNYDLGKYQMQLLKNLTRARSSARKAKVKEGINSPWAR